FGVKPEMVIKGGLIAYANMGDPNASIPTPQPMHYRPQFGSYGKAKTTTSATFVSQASSENQSLQELGLQKALIPVRNTRDIGKKDLVLNNSLPKIEVDPETYIVKADGEELYCEPARVVPLAQRYFLF
ncbi:MAG: urease subunit alpha, partial [Opitutales bacterium]|nr:urease subunit alpha [Opitutales bacterium]